MKTEVRAQKKMKERTKVFSSLELVKVRLSRHNFPVHQDILRVQSTGTSKRGRVSVHVKDVQRSGSSIRPNKRATSVCHDGIRHFWVEGEPLGRRGGVRILVKVKKFDQQNSRGEEKVY